MANPFAGECIVELDGREYTLVFNFGVIAEVENALGGDKMLESYFGDGRVPSRQVLIECIRFGMAKKYRKYTAKQIAEMISRSVHNAEGMMGLWLKIIPAITRQEIETDEGEEGEASPQHSSPEDGAS